MLRVDLTLFVDNPKKFPDKEHSTDYATPESANSPILQFIRNDLVWSHLCSSLHAKHILTLAASATALKDLEGRFSCFDHRRQDQPHHSVRGVIRGVLKGLEFFFGQGPPLGTAPRDHQPPTTNRRQPPTATNRQPPTAANRQRRPTADRQPLPTAINHQSPTTNRRQLPPTATNRQSPTANRQSPPTAYHQSPPTMVEHMSYTRSFCKTAVQEQFFFSS